MNHRIVAYGSIEDSRFLFIDSMLFWERRRLGE
jgi:hypothetical protein